MNRTHSPPPPARAPRIAAAVALVAALVVNGLAQSLPLGGRTTGELSALYPNAVVPVGATFSIWGVIYLGIVAWAIVQFLPSGARLGSRIATLFALTSVLNAAWLVTWHFLLPGLSVVVMIALLTTLVLLHLRLALEAESVADSAAGAAPDPQPARWPLVLTRGAFGLYLGWILVATVVNITAWLVSVGWEGWGLSDGTWGALVAGVGVGVSARVQRRFQNPAMGAAAAWGFLGTAASGAGLGQGAGVVGSWGLPAVTWVAGMGVILLVADGVRIFLEGRRRSAR